MNKEVEREFLDGLVEGKKPCRIFLSRGFQMKGTIIKHDDVVILVKEMGKSQKKIVYKSVISTIEEI